ncbi:hypothetical protein [Bacillus sp. FSL K6-3431]|uniref:hypothetical protein n=1 Tax=Bacillus sp. FSL K6-3431 TaxID=2921500 RepID=UPI0030F696E5
MAIWKEDIHKMIEGLPEEKLKKVMQFLKHLESLDEIEVGKETEHSIKESLEEYNKGEYYTFEEVFGDDE